MSNDIATSHGGHDQATATDTRHLAARLVADARRRPTVLAVWAHPDDETVTAGGLLAALHDQGARVVNVSATLGEHGTDDPVARPPEVLAAVRRRELRHAMTRLGGDRTVLFGYGDGDCADVPVEEGTDRVGEIVERCRPDVVVTFGDDGVTGHPDHRAVATWTERAVAACGHPTSLVTTAAAAAWPDDVVDRLHSITAFWPGYPDHDAATGALRTAVRGRVLRRKLTALHAHRSQVGALVRCLGETGLRRMAAAEAYRPANDRAARLMSSLTPAATATSSGSAIAA